MFAERLVRPSLDWFFQYRMLGLAGELGCWHDAEDFAWFHRHAATTQVTGRLELDAASLVARLLVHTGKRMSELTTADLLGYQQAAARRSTAARGLQTAHELLRGLGVAGVTGPLPSTGVARRQGQLTVEQLVDRYRLACQPVRDVLVRYLLARSAAIDYGSLRVLCHRLVRLFWADLERHHPGIGSLRLDPEVARQWKQRLRTRLDGAPRRDWSAALLDVRAFYLDLAQWAVTDPGAWAAWVAPSPVTEQDLVGMRKHWRQREARIHERIRTLAGLLPTLARATEQRQRHAEALLAAIREATPGEKVVVDGRRHQRRTGGRTLAQRRRAARSLVAVDLDGDGRSLDVVAEEDDAFWAWAATEVLRLTGLRREELQELTHLSIRQYRQPNGKLLLQAFMARRRAARPAEEYREPTAAEWAEFEAHFGKRTMELGWCRRPTAPRASTSTPA